VGQENNMNRPTTDHVTAAFLALVTGCAMGMDPRELDDGGEEDGGSSSTGEPGPGTGQPPGVPQPEVARSFFEGYCIGCHGPQGNGSANINFIDDLVALVTNNLVVPSDPESSLLYIRLTDPENPMPPLAVAKRPTSAEIEAIRGWIAAGALPGEGACETAFIGFDEMIRTMNADIIDNFDEASDRQFIRYLTLTHLHNAGMCDRELDLYRAAIAKGVNSLSLQSLITPPWPVDENATIYRVDLRDYSWDLNPNFVNEDLWDTIAGVNPFAVAFRDGPADDLRVFTGTSVPFQPADSFLQVATGALLAGVDPTQNFYSRILQLPLNLAELEALPFINVPDRAAAIAAGEVFRVIVKDSGVAQANRAFDRYESASFGTYYYRSFDFLGEDGDRNLSKNPTDFVQDAGEMIFTLPNGLQGYALANNLDVLVPEAPTTIVRDNGQRDSVVRVGISCMACHSSGIIATRDEFYDLYKEVEGNFVEE
jgi:hypothetical protein